jgi:hypothetical protein
MTATKVLAALAFGLVAVGSAAAAPVPAAAPDPVAACRWVVRRDIEPTFDAYETRSTVNAFGTPRANFEFFKCLAARGVEVFQNAR